MGYTVREHFHTPLDRAAAEKLVDRLERSLEAGADDDDDDDEGLVDDVTVFVEKEKSPSAEQARSKAAATGYAEHSIKLAPEALARLRSCRTTITLEYEGRVHDHRTVGRLQKMLLDRIGSAVVGSGEDTTLETSEVFKAKVIRERGDLWALEPDEDEDEEEEGEADEPEAPGNGMAGAKAVERLLRRALADPFAKRRLAEAMRAASKMVQQYAALLLEEEAQPDATAAATLKCKPADIAEARSALQTMLLDPED